MGLESATYINGLNASNPVGAVDPKAQGDDHIRLLKSTLQASFPNITGAMTATQTQLNNLVALITGAATPSNKVKGTGAAAAGGSTAFLRSDAQILLDLADTYAWTGQHSWSVALLIPNGSIGTPAIKFASEVSGFYRQAAGVIDWVIAGATTLRLVSGRAQADDGTAALPAWSFFGATNKGMYSSGANRLGFSVNGALVAEINATQMLSPAGTAALPGQGFLNDPDTGPYSFSADVLGFATAGAVRAILYSTALEMQGATRIYSVDGTAAAPGIAFGSDPDLGLLRLGANQLGFGENSVGYRIGFRSIPVSSTTTTLVAEDLGKCVPITAAIAIPVSVFSAGDAVSIYNDSAGALNITIAGGTLRLAGTTTTGTRSLAPRGMATLWFRTGGATPEVIASGNVS